MLDTLLRVLTESVDSVGVFSLGAVALIAKWLVTFRVLVDLLFITNKPTFYKIIEAKKARQSAGAGAEGNAAQAAANAIGGFVSGATNSVKQFGGIDGLFIYLMSFAPNIIIQSSYVDAKTGEINENEAATATIATWLATKAWKIIITASLLSLVSAGLIVNMQNNLSNALKGRTVDMANMINVDGLIDGVIGNSDNLLVAKNDNTMLGLIKRELVDKAMNQGVSSKYKYTADNRTRIRNYIESSIVSGIDSSDLAKLNFVNIPYNAQVMSYSVSVLVRDKAELLSKAKMNSAQKSNSATDTYCYFAIVIPQDHDGELLCDDKDYIPVELLVEARAQTNKTTSYFNGSAVQNDNRTPAEKNKDSEDEYDSIALSSSETKKNFKVDGKTVVVQGKYPTKTNQSLLDLIQDELDEAQIEGTAIYAITFELGDGRKYANVKLDKKSGSGVGKVLTVVLKDDEWELKD